jgi:hypothetical protein
LKGGKKKSQFEIMQKRQEIMLEKRAQWEQKNREYQEIVEMLNE